MVPTASAPASAGQHKEEKLFLIIALVLAAIAGIGCWFAAAALSRKDAVRGIPPDMPRQLADFSLTDRTGRTVTRSELEGNVLVVSFLFTSCATVCPEVSRQMSEIQQLTAADPDVRLVSLTVDPRTDTPSVLAKWGLRYGADTNRWLLLTGPKPLVQGLITTSFLPTNASDPFNYTPGNFTGMERVALVDRHGHVRVYYDGLRAGASDAVAAQIEALRNEK